MVSLKLENLKSTFNYIQFIKFDNHNDMNKHIKNIADSYEGHIPNRIAYNFPLKYMNDSSLQKTISLNQEYCICFVNYTDIAHELLHGIFYKHPQYRDLVTKLYSFMSEYTINKILKTLGYPDHVIIDEFQAYMFSEINPITFFKIKSFDKKSVKYMRRCCKFLLDNNYSYFSEHIKRFLTN